MREVLEETGVQTGRSASSVCARNYTYTSFLSVLACDTHTQTRVLNRIRGQKLANFSF